MLQYNRRSLYIYAKEHYQKANIVATEEGYKKQQ